MISLWRLLDMNQRLAGCGFTKIRCYSEAPGVAPSHLSAAMVTNKFYDEASNYRYCTLTQYGES